MKKRANTTVKILVHLLFLCASALGRGQSFNCDAITFTLQNTGGCCYRLTANNTTPDNCFQQVQLVLDPAIFTNFAPFPGWQWSQTDPNYITVRPSVGFIPFGTSNIATFCVAGGPNTTLNISWDNLCTMESCVLIGGLPVNACAPNGKIRGVKYVDVGCRGEFFNGQPTLPNWPVELFDGSGNLLRAVSTGANGIYEFAGLLPGDYLVREGSQTGWQPGNPQSGAADVTVPDVNATVTQDFGNCPTSCSCDSIYLNLSQQAGSSDTATYFLTAQNREAYCFSYINIQVESGQLLDWEPLLPGWEVSLTGPNQLQLNPPGVLLPAGGPVPLRFRVRGAGDQVFKISTEYGNGSDEVVCTRALSFPSPPTPLAANCCPVGTTGGPELVVDGDFNNPIPPAPVFSYSNYTYQLTTGAMLPGRLVVTDGNSVANFNGLGQWACMGKSGLPTDRFLVVDGSPTAGAVAWSQTLNPSSLTVGAQYAFCAWVNNLVIPQYINHIDPRVVLEIRGGNGYVYLVDSRVLPENPDQWEKLSGLWTMPSGLAPPFQLVVRSAVAANPGNDFALDCISFRQCSAAGPCSVAINSTGNNLCGSGTVTLTASGANLTSCTWSNNLGTGFSKTVTLSATTTYTVTCTDTNGQTCTASTTINVTSILGINGTLIPCFGASTTLTANVAPSTGGTFAWSAGSPGNQQSNTFTNVTAPIPFTITYSNGGCTQTQGWTITPLPLPTLNFSIFPTTFCAGQGPWTITASGTPTGNSYSWPTSAGGGGGSSKTVNPSVTTSYVVTCTATNGCQTTGTATVTVLPAPTGAVSASPNQICQGLPTNLSASGFPAGTTYVWNTPTGGSFNSSYTFYPPNSQGVYNCTLTVTGTNGCTNTYTVPVTVLPAPNLSLAFSPANRTLCLGQTTPGTITANCSGTLTWSAPFYSVSGNMATLSATTNPIGGYGVTVTCTGSNGCASSQTDGFGINPVPTVTLTPASQTVCVGQSAGILANVQSPGTTSYQWSNPPGGTGAAITVTPTVPGTTNYTVTITDQACSNTASASVTTVAAPAPMVTPQNTTICAGQYTTLTVTGGVPPYLWSTLGTGTSEIVNPASTTTYVVTVGFGTGCQATASATVTVLNCGCAPPGPTMMTNGSFSQSTATAACNDIGGPGWSSIWPSGPGLNTADLINSSLSWWNCAIPSVPTCSPASAQGNFAAFAVWKDCFNPGYRQGIRNVLAQKIPANSGWHTLSANIATLEGPWGNPGVTRLAVYGTDQTGPATATIGACSPLNTGLWGPSTAKLLGYLMPLPGTNCPFQPRSLTFLAPTNFDIKTIFLTRPENNGIGGYVAVDDLCVVPLPGGGQPNCNCPTGIARIRDLGGTYVSPWFAGGQAVSNVAAPVPGHSYQFEAWLPCSPMSCTAPTGTATLSTLSGIPVLNQTWTVSTPYVNLTMPASWFGAGGGTYRMTVVSGCGANKCTTTFDFTTVKGNCDCSFNSIVWALLGGYTVGPVNNDWNSCKRVLTPKRLCPNDKAIWIINGNNITPPVTWGQNPLTYTGFPVGTSSNTVLMSMRRYGANGQYCPGTYGGVLNTTLPVTCLYPKPDGSAAAGSCPGNIVANGNFSEGLTPGLLGDSATTLAGWGLAPNFGSGLVYVQDSIGAEGDGSIVLYGRQDNAAGIYQPVEMEWDSFAQVRYRLANLQGPDLPVGTALEFWLQEEPFPGHPSAILLHREPLNFVPDSIFTIWEPRVFSPKTPFGSGTFKGYLVVRLTNENADSTFSVVALDNLEICTAATVETGQPSSGERARVRILPNPNTGQFTVVLPAPASATMFLKIADLAGRTVSEQQAEAGSDRQAVRADRLAPGMYLLQVVSEGKLLAVEKFVKE